MKNKNRLTIFAHFDQDNIIDDYVIYYLQELKKICEKIIFVSDNTLSDSEKEKLKAITDTVIAQSHGEYDFGSYKRGFLHAQDNEMLKKFDEIIFANDSCFGPLHPLADIFDKMDKKTCDFWGITKNEYGFDKKKIKYYPCKRPHLQSYFLVLKENVFNSEPFQNFINSIKKEANKYEIIINSEIGLSETLINEGFIPSQYIETHSESNASILYKWEELIKENNMPFLKTSLPRLKYQNLVISSGWKEAINEVSQYPTELIENNIKRTKQNKEIKILLPIFIQKLFFKLLHDFKMMIKEFRYLLIKNK